MDQYNARIETLTERLGTKRQRLYSQFIAMETALAKLQTQQSALSQIQSISLSSK